MLSAFDVLAILDKLTLCILYGLVGRCLSLHYERENLSCQQYRRQRYLAEAVLTLVFANFAVRMVVESLTPSPGTHPLPYLCHCFLAALPLVVVELQTRRRETYRRLLSCHYMAQKYGLDRALLFSLVEQHRLDSFPVVHYEELIHDAPPGYVCTDKAVRRRMASVVEAGFCVPLGTDDTPAVERLRKRAADPAESVKHEEMDRDWWRK